MDLLLGPMRLRSEAFGGVDLVAVGRQPDTVPQWQTSTRASANSTKAKAIVDDDVAKAVNAYMADPKTGLHPLGDDYQLDLAETVEGHPWAKAEVARADASENLKRHAVRTAILLAYPKKR
ncbi:hypothetical protein [Methylobacterium brachiatum]